MPDERILKFLAGLEKVGKPKRKPIEIMKAKEDSLRRAVNIRRFEKELEPEPKPGPTAADSVKMRTDQARLNFIMGRNLSKGDSLALNIKAPEPVNADLDSTRYLEARMMKDDTIEKTKKKYAPTDEDIIRKDAGYWAGQVDLREKAGIETKYVEKRAKTAIKKLDRIDAKKYAEKLLKDMWEDTELYSGLDDLERKKKITKDARKTVKQNTGFKLEDL